MFAWVKSAGLYKLNFALCTEMFLFMSMKLVYKDEE